MEDIYVNDSKPNDEDVVTNVLWDEVRQCNNYKC